MNISLDDFKRLKCHTPEKYAYWFNLYLPLFGITTINRFCCFFANVLQETLNFFYQEEIASGQAYEGRKNLGNTVKGYGIKYKGRGMGQVTGYSNYAAFNIFVRDVIQIEGLDFVKNPELLLLPQWSVLSAFWFWKTNKLEQWADEGKFKEVCAVWNTGRHNKEPNHYKERKEAYVRVATWFKTLK